MKCAVRYSVLHLKGSFTGKVTRNCREFKTVEKAQAWVRRVQLSPLGLNDDQERVPDPAGSAIYGEFEFVDRAPSSIGYLHTIREATFVPKPKPQSNLIACPVFSAAAG